MSYDGSIKFDTKLDEKGFSKGVKGLESIAKKSMGGINKIFKATGIAVAGIGAIAIKSGADFEKSMNRVGALAGATDIEMKKLTDTARQLGKDTVFSAHEASEAMQNLAMAGFKVNEITDAMPGLLDLASAGQTDLALTSDITASMLRGFQLEASESGRVADVMAKGFTGSNTSLETLGDSMKYVAPVASSLGFSIEETTAAVGKLGDAGIKGTQSGTALRAIMLRLVDPPKQAAEELKRLGITVTDSKGQMKDFPHIIKDMEKATKGMTEAEKAATLSKIAGTNASSALMALINEGGDSLASFTKELENAGGTAQEIAERQLQGLIGQLELLKSELSEIGLKIYDNLDQPLGKVMGTLREYVAELDRVITATETFKNMLNGEDGPDKAALGLTDEDIPDPSAYLAKGIANVLTDLIVALTDGLPQVIQAGGQFVEFFLQGIQDKVPELSTSLSDIITSMIENYITLAPKLIEIGIELVTNIMQGMAESSPRLIESFMESIGSLIETLRENAPLFLEAGIEILSNIVKGLSEGLVENLPAIAGGLTEALSTLLDIVGENLPGIIEFGLEIILALVDGIVEAMPILVEAIPGIIEQIVDIFLENLPAIIEAGGEIILALIDGIVEILPELAIMAVEIIEKLADGLSEHLPDIIKTGIEIILALADGLVEAIPKLLDKIPGIIEKVVVAILDHLPDIIVAGIEIIVALGIGLLRALPRLLAVIPKIIVAIVKALFNHDWAESGRKILTAVKDGLSSMIGTLGAAASKAGKAAIDKIKEKFDEGKEKGKELISKIVDGIKGTASKLWTEASELATKALDKIKEGFTGALDIGKNLVEGIWNGISGATGWLMGKVKGFADDVISGVKGFFGIHSPSRVFRDEIGTELVRGIMVGIQKETPALRKASEKEMMKLVDDYAVYGRKAAEAYGQLNKEEMAELRKQHIKERKITAKMTQEEINEVKKQRAQDGRDLAEAIAKGIEEKTNSVVAALEKLREQSISELDKLGEATITALKARYKEEEDLAIGSIDKRLDIERKASSERISIYEEEARQKILLLDEEQSEIVRMLQAQVDAINDELDAEKEANEEREYQKKLAEAKEKVRVAKTNRERLEAQKAVEELITEKERKEFEKRKKQEIKDLQDAMKAVEDNAKDKIAQLEEDIKSNKEYEEEKLKEIEKGFEDEKEATRKHYEVLLKEEQLQAEARKLILAENNEELVELLDSYNPYWMDAGQSFGESLLDGLNSMKYEIEDVVNDMLSMVATAEIANAKIIQAKLDYEAARIAGDKKGMAQAHKQAEAYRKQGGNIGKDIALKTANYEREINQKTKSEKDYNPYSKGVTQNIKIVSPSNTPAENARLMKRKGEELTLGY